MVVPGTRAMSKKPSVHHLSPEASELGTLAFHSRIPLLAPDSLDKDRSQAVGTADTLVAEKIERSRHSFVLGRV